MINSTIYRAIQKKEQNKTRKKRNFRTNTKKSEGNYFFPRSDTETK